MVCCRLTPKILLMYHSEDSVDVSVSFSVINNLGTPSSELQINFGVLQTGTENSATGSIGVKKWQFISDPFIDTAWTHYIFLKQEKAICGKYKISYFSCSLFRSAEKV